MNFADLFKFRIPIFLFVLSIGSGCKTTSTTSNLTPHLTEPLRFANFTVSDISAQGVSNLMKQRVYIGQDNPDPKDYDWVVRSNQTSTIHAETIKEFRAKVENKCEDETSFGRVKYQWVKSASDLLDFMAKARSSQHSYLKQDYFMDLPVSVLSGDMEGSKDDALKNDAAQGKTLRDYTKREALFHLRNIKIEGNTMRFYDADNEYDYVVKELARGDVDGDGCEDALVLIGCHTQGTLGWSETKIMTRTGPEQKIKVVELDHIQKK